MDGPRLKGIKSFRCAFGPPTQTDYVWPPPPAELEETGELPPSEDAVALARDADPDVSGVDRPAELVWPPPAADLEACSVVRLSEEDDADGQPVAVTIEDFRIHSSTPAAAAVPSQEDVPTVELPIPASVLARLNAAAPPAAPPAPVDLASFPVEPPPLVPFASGEPDLDDELEEDAPTYDFPPPSHEPPAEARRPRGSGLAWAAVLMAISGLAVGYSEYRAGRREALRAVHASDAPAPVATPSAPAPAPPIEVARTPEPPASAPPRSSVTSKPALKDTTPNERTRVAAPPRRPAPEPEPRVVLRAASAAPLRQPPPSSEQTAAASPAPAPVRTVAASAPPRDPVPAPAPPLATPPASAAEPVVHTAAVNDAAEGAAGVDEQRIASTLTRWRTAYSKLDARAAREVWPSVDVEALDRAFRSLKSQDLRFDQCDLTVEGSRARAACRGSAVYVPRVGNQSPKATPREWTFELRKADQRWTIASARSS